MQLGFINFVFLKISRFTFLFTGSIPKCSPWTCRGLCRFQCSPKNQRKTWNIQILKKVVKYWNIKKVGQIFKWFIDIWSQQEHLALCCQTKGLLHSTESAIFWNLIKIVKQCQARTFTITTNITITTFTNSKTTFHGDDCQSSQSNNPRLPRHNPRSGLKIRIVCHYRQTKATVRQVAIIAPVL